MKGRGKGKPGFPLKEGGWGETLVSPTWVSPTWVSPTWVSPINMNYNY